MDVTEPGGQQRQPGLPVLACGVGVQHRADSEGVPQVVDAWPARRRPWREPGQLGPAGGTRCGRCSRSAGSRRWRRTTPVVAGGRGEPVTQSLIAAQRVDGAGMQRQLPGLAELAVPHQRAARWQVDVAAVERDRLPDPDAGHRQQPDQRGERGPPQRGAQATAWPRSARRCRRRNTSTGWRAAAAAATALRPAPRAPGRGRAGRWRSRAPPRAGRPTSSSSPLAGSRAQSSAAPTVIVVSPARSRWSRNWLSSFSGRASR